MTRLRAGLSAAGTATGNTPLAVRLAGDGGMIYFRERYFEATATGMNFVVMN
jgi:hypothetical protein